MTTYRNAVASDVIDLIGLVEEYCDEVNVGHDIASVKKYIDFQLGKIPTIIAADEDNKAIGVISFVLLPNPFKHEEKVGRKIACFVSKEYRDKEIGSELLLNAERLCKEQGAIKFYYSSPTELEGYTTFETEYVKEL